MKLDNTAAHLQSVFASELKAKLAVGSCSHTSCSEASESLSVYSLGLHHTVPFERHMFSDSTSVSGTKPAAPVTTSSVPTIAATSAPAQAKPKTALSKLVEFPGDPAKLREYLADDSIALNGKDMYGLTALMKFAAWDKVDLLEILLPRLSAEEVNATGGKQKLPLLHYCVDMDAANTLRVLLRDTRVDQEAVDECGRTFRAHAEYFHKQCLLSSVLEPLLS